jgi:hypothetical protein
VAGVKEALDKMPITELRGLQEPVEVVVEPVQLTVRDIREVLA